MSDHYARPAGGDGRFPDPATPPAGPGQQPGAGFPAAGQPPYPGAVPPGVVLPGVMPPVPGQPPYPLPTVGGGAYPPPPVDFLNRRRRPWKIALMISLPVVLMMVLCGGTLFWFVSQDGPAGQALPSYSAPPRPLSYAEERAKAEADAKSVIVSALEKQSAALLRGDRQQFIAIVDKQSTKRSVTSATAWLSERFDSLRALRVARWTAEPVKLRTMGGGDWSGDVKVSYCLVDPKCHPATVSLHMEWQLAPDGARLRAIWPSAFSSTPPWAKSKLKAVVGARVVVASTWANAGYLSALLPKADAAAKVADKYALAGAPGRYVVYVAGKKEWSLWPASTIGTWVAGYANESTQSVVIRSTYLAKPGVPEILRHELAHVATLSGRVDGVDREEAWWLTEGMAEYVSEGGRPFSAYSDRYATVRFVRNSWRGDLRVGAPADRASDVEAAGRYGVAYLGVRCLIEKYGKNDALKFFSQVAVEGESLSRAAPSTLGAQWPAVSKTCAGYVRGAAR